VKTMNDQLTFDDLPFDGSDYNPEEDQIRLTGQINRIFTLMFDQEWRTLSEIEAITGDPQASVSAQLRNLRKTQFGTNIVNKRRRGDRNQGLFEYQVVDGE